MKQLTFSLEEPPVNLSVSQDCEKGLKIPEEISCLRFLELLTNTNLSGSFGKTCRVSLVPTKDGILEPSLGRWQNSGMGGPTESLTLNSSECHKDAAVSSLLDVLETGEVPPRFFLSPKACAGILRRAEKRGKMLPKLLELSLRRVAGSTGPQEMPTS